MFEDLVELLYLLFFQMTDSNKKENKFGDRKCGLRHPGEIGTVTGGVI